MKSLLIFLVLFASCNSNSYRKGSAIIVKKEMILPSYYKFTYEYPLYDVNGQIVKYDQDYTEGKVDLYKLGDTVIHR
jgi:hypothetical protein